jgi:protein phosphatase
MPNSGTIELQGLRAVYGTLAGSKPGDNQDAALVAAAPQGAVCAVADGVSSTPAAAAAAGAAVEAALAGYLAAAGDDAGDALRKAVESAHQAVERAAPAHSGATTIVVAAVRGGRVHVANAGDSRAYLYTPDGMLEQITADHSWVEEQVQAGTLERSLAAAHPWRSVITRYLGGDAPPQVDVFDRTLSPGSGVLLCTDGLLAALSEREVTAALSCGDPAEALSELLRAAGGRGAYDDVTICIVQRDAAGAGDADR